MGTDSNVSGIAREIEGQKPGVSPGQETGAAGDHQASEGAPGGSAAEKPRQARGKSKLKTKSRAELQREFAHLRDREGLSFDPELHLWDSKKDEPETTKAGVLKRRPGPRGRRSSSASQSYIPPETGGAEGAAEQVVTERDLARTSARVLASTWFSICSLLLGPKASAADEYREREQLEEAWTEYFVIRGRPNIPPSLLVGQAMGAHLARALREEESRSRIRKFGEWLRSRKNRRQRNTGQAKPEGEEGAQRSRGAGRQDAT